MAVNSPFQIVDRNGGSPPVKDCDLARQFTPHEEHVWEKRPGTPFKCEGILPVDEQPPCQIYVSPEQPQCGEPAPAKIRVKTKTVDGRLAACARHKKQYDSTAATARAHRGLAPHSQAS